MKHGSNEYRKHVRNQFESTTRICVTTSNQLFVRSLQRMHRQYNMALITHFQTRYYEISYFITKIKIALFAYFFCSFLIWTQDTSKLRMVKTSENKFYYGDDRNSSVPKNNFTNIYQLFSVYITQLLETCKRETKTLQYSII